MATTAPEDALKLVLDACALAPTEHSLIQVYQEEAIEKVKNGELPLKRVVNQTLAAACQSPSRATEVHVRAFVKALAALPGVPEAFAAVLAARVKVFAKTLSTARLAVLRLSCVVVDVAVTQDATASAWLKDVLAAQAVLLEATLADAPRVTALAQKAVHQLVKTHTALLLPLYVDTVLRADAACFSLWAVLAQSPTALTRDVDEQLWTKYASWAFESKASSAAAVAAATALAPRDVRFARLDYAAFDACIKPTLAKMLKRGADAILAATTALVTAAPLDFGRYIPELFASLLTTKLRSTKEDVRALTVALATALMATCEDATHIVGVVSDMAALLDGKYGILAQFYMREAIFAVLSNAADTAAAVVSATDAKTMAAPACTALLKAINKEAHDQTRHLGLLALGKWLALAQELTAETAASIHAGLTHKSEAVVAGYLRALVVFCRSTAATSASGVHLIDRFADDIVRVIQDATKKPNVVHLDAVLAVSLAGFLASASSAMDAKMAADGVVDAVLSDASFLDVSVRALLASLKTAGDEAVERPEVSALAALPTALAWVLASAHEQPLRQAYKLTVELLVSSVRPAQASAQTAIRSLYAASLEHCDGLVQAFAHKLTAVAHADVDAKRARAALAASTDITTDVSVIPPAGVLRKALRVVVPENVASDDSVRDAVFATVFLAAHHPFVVSGTKQAAFGREWRSLKLRFLHAAPEAATKDANGDDEGDEDEEEEETSDDRIDHLLEANEHIKQSIRAILTSDPAGALFSPLAVERLGAQRMLATLLSFAGNGEGESLALHDIIQNALVQRIDRLEVRAISDYDVQVYLTPADELYVASKKKKDASGDVGVSSTRKRGTGRRGNEDEQWEQQVREELERKKQATATKVKTSYTAEERALLATQQRLRAALEHKRTVIASVLETIEMLATTRPDELHPAIPYLLQASSALFACELFEQEASSALRSIARAITPELLRHHYEDVANALRVVFALAHLESSGDRARAVAAMHVLFTRTLAGLMEYVFGFQFDSEVDFDGDAPVNHLAPPTFHLVFPILRAVLEHAPSLRHWALPLFAVHARMIPDEEEEEIGDVAAQRLLRKDMIVLTLELLADKATGGSAPITNDDLAPSRLLTTLCAGPALSSDEWTPLLGDSGVLSEFHDVRLAVLKAVAHVVDDGADDDADDAAPLDVSANPVLASRLFFATFDTDASCQSVAKHVWDATASAITPLFAGQLLVLLNHAHANVRESAALALAAGMKQFPETITPILNNLKTQFVSSLPKPLESLDEFGIPKVKRPGQGEPKEEPATYLPRCGVGLCLEKAVAAATFSKANVMDVMSFVIEHGLGDSNATVRTQMRKTGIQVVDACGGGSNTSELLAVFEAFMDTKPSAGAQDHAIYDHQREGVVVCLGALAKHMDKTDPKVSSIVDSLLEALSIPSESVQRSVATCLTPLIPAVKDRSTAILDALLARATAGETFGERIGAAFGVSAVVKGLGISALKQHDIIPRLEDAMKTGGANARQGAMLVFECLSQRLGILFEPYIIVILPIMLKCFADASPQVRDAASQTAKGIMANLSAHGVKLVLPSVLRALEDSAWRTKQGGIQILGSMAYCAPRQLGSCLPQVVPKLTEALTDSHPKVRESGKSALRDIGSVVRNPEIATISHALLNALEDPNKYTPEALQQLQSTSFVHSIDAPSLALVMPIITRGLKDRGGDAKKKAALIVGSMCSMINDAKDLIPYMDMVLPSLKSQLMDPIPEVRAVAAKAMGKLVKGLGEKHFADILAWLLDAMKGDFGSVERSGAAQGLCEVLVALGKDRVEATLFDEIFPLARHPKYSVREGVLWIIAFLPPAFGKSFSVFLGDALPIVVAGLSDEAESVRDVAMHAGHVVVNAHALSHTREILPSLEAGLFDDSWRIRQSSVALLGDLMYRISGTRAVGVADGHDDDGDDDNDDAAGSAAGDKAIIKILGMARRNNILASLYMIRSDTSAVVRQSALQVWKSVVANTPKTLRQILEALMNAIVNALSGDNVEKQTMAGRTLGEIVRKLGEHVLPEIVPILRSGLSPRNSSGMRQGVCIGLAEVIDCSTKKQLEDYVDTLVDAVLDGLCDELPEVRNSAAQAFDVLQKGIGYRAIDETVPSLLQRIRSSDAQAQERALLGLQEILRVKSREVLPYLIPRLLTTPVTTAAARAISRVAQATGAVIHFQLERILSVFVSQYVALKTSDDDTSSVAEDIQMALRDVVLSVEGVGVHWLAIELCKYCESEVVTERVLAFDLIAHFCSHTAVAYNDQVALFLRQIVTHLNDHEGVVVQAASDAFKGLNVSVRPEQLTQHLDFIRQTINTLVSDARHRKGGVGAGEYLLPGLCIAKGLEPFLPSYQHALMNGSPELRQSAATGLGELVQLTSAAALRPYLIKLTGPLIRIAGDRFPGHVKAAILSTLEILLVKGGVALKPFLPQLQTTFVKALNDNATEVRNRGASALSKLVTLSPRVDPLIAELTEKLRTTDGGIREANLAAVASIVDVVGDKISPSVNAALQDALVELLDAADDTVRERASKCLAFAVAADADAGEANVVRYGLADGKALSAGVQWPRRHSAALFLEHVLLQNPSWIGGVAPNVRDALVVLGSDEHVTVRASALRAIAALVKQSHAAPDAFIGVLVDGVKHNNKDVCKTAVKIAKRLAKKDASAMRAHVPVLVPAIFQTIKSNNIAVKISSERALLYLLEVHTRPEALASFVQSADASDGKVIAEYARRVLAKLRADSGDESS